MSLRGFAHAPTFFFCISQGVYHRRLDQRLCARLRHPRANAWLDFLALHGVSYANWAIRDEDEACSASAPEANTNGGWSDGELTASGRYMKGAMSGQGGGGGSGGCCRLGADCGDCGEDGTGWCHQSSSNCAQCTGSFDPSGSSPGCR